MLHSLMSSGSMMHSFMMRWLTNSSSMKPRSMMRGAVTASLLGISFVAMPASVHAQTATASDVTQGESLFERAYDAYTKGNFHQAAPLFEQAAAYFPHCPTSTVLRAKSLEQIGRLGEAYEAYADVNPKPASTDEAPPCAEARRDAQARTRALDKQVGWLRLELAAPNAAQVWLQLPNAPGPAANRERYARKLPPLASPATVPQATQVWERLAVTAGVVVVAINAEGAGAQTLTVAPGATVNVSFAPASAEAGQSEPSQAAPNDTVDAVPSASPAYGEPWMWVGGVGVAGLVVGTITGLVASSKTDDVKAECDSAAQLCTPKGITARDSAENFGWVSNISLGIGIAGVVAAGVLYLNSDADAPPQADVGRVRLLPGVASSSGAEGATLRVTW